MNIAFKVQDYKSADRDSVVPMVIVLFDSIVVLNTLEQLIRCAISLSQVTQQTQ